jgi:hypothetical protein
LPVAAILPLVPARVKQNSELDGEQNSKSASKSANRRKSARTATSAAKWQAMTAKWQARSACIWACTGLRRLYLPVFAVFTLPHCRIRRIRQFVLRADIVFCPLQCYNAYASGHIRQNQL